MPLPTPPGTYRTTIARFRAWEWYRKKQGRPAPCWGYYLHHLETWPARQLAQQKANATRMNDKRWKGGGPAGATKKSKGTERVAKKIKEKLYTDQVMKRAGITPAEVRMFLAADRRRCA